MSAFRRKEFAFKQKIDKLTQTLGTDHPLLIEKRKKSVNLLKRPVVIFSQKCQRENQFEALKIHTILVRNHLERL
jgi:hypothetical protein